jgi:hypothetical protein
MMHVVYATIGLLVYIWLKLDTMNDETPKDIKKSQLFMMFLDKDVFKILMAISSIPLQILFVSLLEKAHDESLLFEWVREIRPRIVYSQDLLYPPLTFFSSYLILKGKTKAEKFIDEKLK